MKADMRLRSQVSGWAPGVTIGFAIYAGMFVAAGAWRSDEVTTALATGKAVPLAGALQSFNVAVNAATGAVQVAEARADQPVMRFATPQRVQITAAMDSSGVLPVVAAPAAPATVVPAVAKVPAAAAPTIRLYEVDDGIASAAYVPPARLVAIAPLAVVQIDPVDTAPLDMRGSEPF